jgi:hypothetical protein
MKRSIYQIIILLIGGIMLLPMGAAAVTVGQIDTFEDNTTQNWVVGILGAGDPNPPVNVPTGGPGDAGHHYLLLTSVSTDLSGNKLSVINLTQWTGNYVAAGVGTISMDVNNLGPTDLNLRLFFGGGTPGSPPLHTAVSTNPVTVRAGSGWTSVDFPIDPASLTALKGNVLTALTNTIELRIIHNPQPTFPPPSVDTQLGVDNIKLFRTPFVATKASYSRDNDGATTLFAYATAPEPFINGTSISARVGTSSVPLVRRGRSFFRSLALGNVPPPASLRFTGTTNGVSPTTLTKPVTDEVFISQATYSESGHVIVVTADSSDQFQATPLVLTIKGAGSFSPVNYGGGTTVISGVTVPPKDIRVTSSLGGSDTAPVSIVP